MDQAKTKVPHSAEESKSNAEFDKLQLHITIVRIFNGEEVCYMITFFTFV